MATGQKDDGGRRAAQIYCQTIAADTPATDASRKGIDSIAGYPKSRSDVTRDRIGFWLMVLLLFLLPIQRLWLPFGLTLADLVLVVLILYSLGRVWHTQQRLVFPLLLPMWLILFSSLVATLVGFAHMDSVVAIVQEIYIFAWFIALTNLLSRFPVSDLDRLMKVWSIVVCIETVTLVMGMFRIGPSIFYIKPRRDEMVIVREVTTEFVRAIGTFVNSNAAAAYVSASFFALLATSWPIWLRSLLGIWVLVGMFATGSNGALLSTFGSLALLVGVFSIVRKREDIKLLVAVSGVGIGLVGTVLLLLGLSSSFLGELGLGTGDPLLFQTIGRFSHSAASRLDIVGWAWNTYRRNLWGTGPNSFSLLGGSLHSDYVAFWFERGPLGIIGWLWLIGEALFRPLQMIQWSDGLPGSRHQRWQVLTLAAGFLASAVNAFSHEVSHMRQVWMGIVFLFVLSYVGNTKRQRPRSYE